MFSIIRPLRAVIRKLRRSPSFTLLSTLTLGIGIGANTAIFSVVNGVLLEPLPYPEPERLVGVWHTAPGIELPQFEQSDATYLLYRQHNRVFEDLALYDQGTLNFTGIERPEQLPAAAVTASLFPTLGVAPAMGRDFTEADEKPGAEPVVVISHEFHASRFGGEDTILGQTIEIDGVARTVVGVMPAGFRFPAVDTLLWEPMAIDPEATNVGNFSYVGIARLKPGKTPQDAAAELSTLVHRLPELFPSEEITAGMIEGVGLAALVHPLRDDVVGDVGRVLWVLLGSVGFILLIACANVANLFLVRAEKRQREVAIRSALGAQRSDIAGAFLVESALLGLAGGFIGLALAAAGVRVLTSLGPGTVPRLENIGIDGGVLAFTAAISLFAGLLFGAMPALRRAPNLGTALKDGSLRTTAGRAQQRASNTLVAGQIALALILLTGSGLMVRSFLALRNVDPGFDPANVLTLRLSLPATQYPEAEERARFVHQAIERIQALPGVETAGAVTRLPMAAGGSNSGYAFEDFPLEPDEVPRIIATRRTAPGYFETLNIPLVAGRVFEPADHQEAKRVVLISQALATQLWGDTSPMGRRLANGLAEQEDWYTIVGVVGSIHDEGLAEDPTEAIYFPMVSPPSPTADADAGATAAQTMSFTVRTKVPPETLAGAVRSAIWQADPNLPVANVRTMDEIVADDSARAGFTMILLVIAAMVALLLGTIGLYSVISYVVNQRTQEIGVRMALGAGRGAVSRMVVRQGLGVAVAGIAVGFVGSLAATRLLEASLFGVGATDPLTFVTVSLLLFAVTLIASYLPARRAASVDPLVALRHE